MVEHQQLEQKLCTPLEVQRMYLKKTTPSKKIYNYYKTLPRIVSNGGSFPRSEIYCKTIIFNCF